MSPQDVVERARRFVGTPFRPQGRNREQGFDCAGLTIAVFEIPPHQVPANYRLRGSHEAELGEQIRNFFVPVPKPRAGDLLLCRVAAEQVHLAIDCGETFVHADASLRRVVETPGRPRWPVIGSYRYSCISEEM